MAVDACIWFLHLFRMPLFFVVAGFFAAMLVARRGIGGLFRNRVRRIALPFVIRAAVIDTSQARPLELSHVIAWLPERIATTTPYSTAAGTLGADPPRRVGARTR